MYDLRCLPNNKHLRAASCVLACALFGFQVTAHAQDSMGAFRWVAGQVLGASTTPSGSTAVDFPTTSTASSAGASLATGSRSIPAMPVNLSGWTTAGNYGVTPAPTGATVGATYRATLSSGKVADMAVRAAVTPRSAGKVVGTLLLGASGGTLGLALGAGSLLYDLLQEVGYTADTSGGALTLQKADPSTCSSIGGCVMWSGPYSAQLFQTAQQACVSTAALKPPNPAGSTYAAFSSTSGCVMSWTWPTGSCASCAYEPLNQVNVPYSPSVLRPATITDLENEIALKSGWPTTSKLAPVLAEAIKLGVPVEVQKPTLTGPASVQGPTETKATPAQNGQPAKTETTSTVHNITYEGNTYKISNTTNNTVEEGTKITVTTTTSEPAPESDPCKTNPTSNGCRTDEFDVPTGDIPKTTKNITFQAENLGFGGGSCPQNVTMTAHGMSSPMTIIDWQDNCSKIVTYAKPMILSLALFSALMIIFVGGKPE